MILESSWAMMAKEVWCLFSTRRDLCLTIWGSSEKALRWFWRLRSKTAMLLAILFSCLFMTLVSKMILQLQSAHVENLRIFFRKRLKDFLRALKISFREVWIFFTRVTVMFIVIEMHLQLIYSYTSHDHKIINDNNIINLNR